MLLGVSEQHLRGQTALGSWKRNSTSLNLWRTGLYLFIYLFIYLLRLFRAKPTAHGRFQARSQIGAEAAAYAIATATPDPSGLSDLHHSPQPQQVLNLLSKARD